MSILLLIMASLGDPGKKKQKKNVIYLNTGFYEIFLTLAFESFNMYFIQKTPSVESISKHVWRIR